MANKCVCKPVYRQGKPRKIEGEWVVPVFKNGKRDEGKTYYTDDKADAFATAVLGQDWIDKENKRLCKCRK